MSRELLSDRLINKVTIITGASSGLGRAIALAFAANGAGPILCADLGPNARGTWGVDEPGVPTHELINSRYGDGRALFIKTDVTVAADVENMVKEAVKAGGRLDVLVNNAGTGGTETAGKIHEMTEQTWDFTMTINARSVFLGTKYAIAQFLAQSPHKQSGHRGWIINTASMLGIVGLQPSAAAYCASKGAVVLLTKQVAVEYAKDKIHCNALCPGYLKTPMTEPIYNDVATREGINAMTPWGEWGLPEDVAKCAVFLASDDAAYVTGVPLVIDGGYTAQ
ncbi:MAG: hypothetical protein Q9213_000204 [Squamulea squamosa]